MEARRGEIDMVATYEITEITLTAQPAATIRESTTMVNLGAALSEIFASVEEYLKELGVQPAGLPFARYHHAGPTGVDVEAGFPVPNPLPRRWRIVATQLPAGPAVSTWHVGPYETIGQAYEALDAWIREHGRERGGPPWEVYWTDPTEVTDQSQWRTQLIQPLAG